MTPGSVVETLPNSAPTGASGKPSAPRLWPGSTIVCLASGPSLVPEDVDYVRGRAPVIVINSTYRLAPWADVLYACDQKWWKWERDRVGRFAGVKFSMHAYPTPSPNRLPARLLPRNERPIDVCTLENTGDEGLELAPTGLRTGKNSGYQAMNLAAHLGAARIVLLGYDMKLGRDGSRHWHVPHPDRSESPYVSFIQRFATLVDPLARAGIDVLNCTRSTALPYWPRVPLREVLR